MRTWCTLLAVALCAYGMAGQALPEDDKKPAAVAATPVSYHKQILPIFQAHCQGCHQPAILRGDYDMTTFAKLLKGGETGVDAVIPGKPQESFLVELITPHASSKAKMPQGKKPLADQEIDLIKRWVAEGAKDDTPANARQKYDKDNLPVYTRPPVITSIDYAPDGKTLAVAGFHEVLLTDPETGKLLARLVGLAERIQSVRFSPDGKRLAVTGGLPGRIGEVQIWDVEKRQLLLSVPVTYDTVYGASWSPDGTKIAFGCGDNTLRAIDAKTGEQILYMGSHTDWPLATVFSTEGTHLISAGRDMTTKLTEVQTQRFVDNITSITPGALKGGIQSVARHPTRNEIAIGGSDGVVKVYRVHRLTNRVIGDDANLIRQMPPMKGRIFSVAVSRDGKRIAAGSSLDGSGEVAVYGYEFSTDLPENIKKINQKVVTERKPDEKAALEKYHSDGVKVISKLEMKASGAYAVSFRPDGKMIAVACTDGVIRMIDAEKGTIQKEFAPAPMNKGKVATAGKTKVQYPIEKPGKEKPTDMTSVLGLQVEPKSIQLSHPFAYAQLVVTATMGSGDKVDVTRQVLAQPVQPLVETTASGFVMPRAEGKTTLTLHYGGQTAHVPVIVSGLNSEYEADYVRDVQPILSRMGCNAGTCHGSAQGKNGFKLSLRGYDPIHDVRALTDDLQSRRVNLASPDDSLMLLKTTGAVPHVGGQLTKPGEPYYEILRNWISHGAKLNSKSAKVAKIEVTPQNPVVQAVGAQQQLRVLATYADGRMRDVTQESFLESGNGDVATAQRGGLMTALRRGEAPMLARFEGAYAATTLTVMGDRTGFAWKEPLKFNRIDEFTAAKWQRMKILPAELCTDSEFIRRVHLDLTGLPPTADEVRAFLADTRPSPVKRTALIDKLIGSDPFVEHWANKWADLLQVNRKFLGNEGAVTFRKWIRDEVARNTPYDEFVRKVLTAKGSNKDNPPASYYKVLRDPSSIMENTTHLFLAVRFNCNKCHDHPFERWTQDNYYQTAAFFAQVELKNDPQSAGKKLGGTDVEAPKPLYEIISDKPTGDITHERTGDVTPPAFPYPTKVTTTPTATRREQMAAWLTAKDNQYFARSYVNRLWGYMFGVGIIDPIDDIRAGNPPTNPELLDYLTEEFIKSGYNTRHIIQLICKSRTYQLSVTTHKWNEDDKINYSHATARRLPAEVLLDSVYRVTGTQSKFPGVAPGTRAAALPDAGSEVASGFLGTFGRPPRESACECERVNSMQLGPVMALVNGQTLAEAIADPNNDIAKLVATEKDDTKLVKELFLRILNREATPAEIEASRAIIRRIDEDHRGLAIAIAQREIDMLPKLAQWEQERVAAMAKSQAELTAYEKELAPKIAELEKQRLAKIAQLEADLKKYEETAIPTKMAKWEKEQRTAIDWVRLNPRSLSATQGTRLVKQDDLSVLAMDKIENSVYTFQTTTDLRGITALRLEVLADEKLPGGGPGRSGNGNFVLVEFKVEIASKADPKKTQRLVFVNPRSSFHQESFQIENAVNGQPNGQTGWAVAPRVGQSHWAVLPLKEPIGYEGGTQMTITLNQRSVHNNHTIGRFRISATAAKLPLPLGVSEDLEAVIDIPKEKRDPKQQARLLLHYRQSDAELQGKESALAIARQPLPIDPKLQTLQKQLAEVSKPVPPDGELERLRKDFEASKQQLANKRLTAAQDIAWALINSPAFLFNR
jgi:WD40 repeat protein/mono/diheme cytochrome c family protein